MIATYYPEMGHAKPAAEIEARTAYGSKISLKTPLTLTGRGVTDTGKLGSGACTSERATWNTYLVTRAAFEKIAKAHSVAWECLLD